VSATVLTVVGVSAEVVANSAISSVYFSKADTPQGFTAPSNPYKFAAYNTINQTGVANGVLTNLTLGTEEFDTNNNFTGGTYTVPVTGFYMITGMVGMSGSPGLIQGSIGCDIQKNGTTSILQSTMSFDNGVSYDAISCEASGIVSLTAGDTIRLRGVVTVSSGTVTFPSGVGNRMSGFLVSRT